MTIRREDTLRLIWFKIIGQVFWNTKSHYSYFLTPSVSGETTFPDSNKRKRFSKIVFNSPNKINCKTSKMRVAIPKLYFPIDPQDNMEAYLKNTEKVAALSFVVWVKNNCYFCITKFLKQTLLKAQSVFFFPPFD